MVLATGRQISSFVYHRLPILEVSLVSKLSKSGLPQNDEAKSLFDDQYCRISHRHGRLHFDLPVGSG
jgi:hypothetical protein